jgi:hypothetical protein
MTTLAAIQQLSQWWDGLPLAQQFFFGVGILAGFTTLVLGVLSLLGMEHHDSTDALAGDLDDGAGGIFSVKPLTGFFLGFGWSGGIALSNGYGMLAATAVALVSGTAIMAAVVMMFKAIWSLKSDGTLRVENAVGATGTVYITLPPNRAVGGQVIVNFTGRQETYGALSVAERPLPSGEKVKVLQIIDPRTILVEPL